MHSGPEPSIAWHCDGEFKASYGYERKKQEFISGEEAKRALAGEGHSVANRTIYQPFKPQSKFDELRHWRQQEIDKKSGRTMMSKTMEHAWVQEFERTATPERKGKSQMQNNLQVIHQRSQQNKLINGRKKPLTDDDLIKMSEQCVPTSQLAKLSEWLKTASLEEKEQYRAVFTSMRPMPERFLNVPIARPQTSQRPEQSRPSTSASMAQESLRPRTQGGHRRKANIETIVADLKARIRRRFDDGTATNQELLNSFRYFDVMRTGFVSKEVLLEVMSGINVPVAYSQLDAVEELLDVDFGHGVDYMEFVRHMVPQRHSDDDDKAVFVVPMQIREIADVDSSHWKNITNEQLLQLLRNKISAKVGAGPNQLMKSFRHFDKDRSSKIDVGELAQVLHEFGIFVPDFQVEQLIKMFDLDGSATVDFAEFVTTVLEKDFDEDVKGSMIFGRGAKPEEVKHGAGASKGMKSNKFYVPSRTNIRPLIAGNAPGVIEGLRLLLRDHIWQRFPNMRVAFKSIVSKSKGQGAAKEDSRVSLFAFVKALKDWHISASPAEARALFERLDQDKDGFLHYNDFVASLGPLTKEMNSKEAAAAHQQHLQMRAASVHHHDASTTSKDFLRQSTPTHSLKLSQERGGGSGRGLAGSARNGMDSSSRPRTADLFLMRPKSRAGM